MFMYIVLDDEAGWSLRKWLRYQAVIDYPTLCTLARKRFIRINGKVAKLTDVVEAGDMVELRTIEVKAPSKIVDLSPIEDMIVFENDEFAVIENPYGIAAQGEDDSIAAITNAFIVQRLDKTTSGLMLLAKTKHAADALSAQLREHQLQKTYHAIVVGQTQDHGEWVWDIEGKQAQTKYRKLEEIDGKTLLEVHPITGRKHQIRIHAAMNGTPILGDCKYGLQNGYQEQNRKYESQNGAKAQDRVYLHCHELALNSPKMGFISKINLTVGE